MEREYSVRTRDLLAQIRENAWRAEQHRTHALRRLEELAELARDRQPGTGR